MIDCHPQNEFKRNITFNAIWETMPENQNMITANFNTNVDPDKIYLIQVSPGNNIKQLQINNAEIKGTFAEKNKIYNITE